MAVPNINVIYDTPTSPNHVPRPIYTSPELPRVPEDGLAAPEVDRYAEGLQVDPNGAYPQPTTREMDTNEKHWCAFGGSTGSEKQNQYDDSGLIPYESSIKQKEGRVCKLKRRTFMIVAIIALVIVCAAIGGGVGGYFASKPDTPSPTPTLGFDPEDGTPIQTTGTTGMAFRPCQATKAAGDAPQATPRNITNPWNSHGGKNKGGATYDITCRRGVPTTGDKEGNKVYSVGHFITYTFTDCMDKCTDNELCASVVYGANLTDMVADGTPGTNCLLKNATFEPVERKNMWMASAVKQT